MLSVFVKEGDYWRDKVLAGERLYDKQVTEFSKQYNVTFDLAVEHAIKCELSNQHFRLRDIPQHPISDSRIKEMKLLLGVDDEFFKYLEHEIVGFVKAVLNKEEQ